MNNGERNTENGERRTNEGMPKVIASNFELCNDDYLSVSYKAHDFAPLHTL